MSDILTRLKALHRPRLLIRAARLGQADYNRNRDLPRLTKSTSVPTPLRAMGTLMSQEAELEEGRTARLATYSIVKHVEVLSALMGEARLLTQTG